jgi:MFS transporter, DHA2 family, multidrug resistance protein
MSAAATTFPIDHSEWRPTVNPWIIALTVTLATFMEVLDTSIANVALPHIAGSLSAGMRALGCSPRISFRTRSYCR